jgi:hypothetical protein
MKGTDVSSLKHAYKSEIYFKAVSCRTGVKKPTNGTIFNDLYIRFHVHWLMFEVVPNKTKFVMETNILFQMSAVP